MSTGKPQYRVATPWQVGGALALIALAPATALAQGPAPEPLPAPADSAQPLAPVAAPPLAPPAAAPPPPPPVTYAAPPPPLPAPAPLYVPPPPAALAVDPAATSASTSAGTATSDAHSPVPVTVLDRELLAATGTASLGQALQQLSWQSNAINTQFNNGGDGSTRLSLRGLGAGRTLVLVNGRRHVHGGTGADASVDLEALPLALVERVEIVRGPAGAHGLGALGGVVNVVTRQDLDGVEAELFAGGTPDGLGQTYDASVALGQRFERGRVVAAAGYYEQQALLGTEREFGRSDLLYDFSTGEVTSLGSTATPEGSIQDYGEALGNEAWQELVNQNPDTSHFYNDPNVGWRAFQATGNSDIGEGDYYNYAPENYLVTPLSRYHVFAAGDYQLGDQLRAFAEASFVNRRSEQQLASTPLFTVTEGAIVSADNVYNPFGRDFIDMRRRVVEAGPRRTQQDIDTVRVVVGLDGALPVNLGTPSAWRWEATYGFGATDSNQTLQGNLRRDRLQNALGPGFIDADGQPRCGTVDNPIAGCVPLNLFGGLGSITPEMLDYLGYDAVVQGHNEQHRVAVDAGGDLLRTASGAGASLAFGAEYRDESGSVTPDPVDLTGVSDGAVDGSFDVRALHATLSVIPFIDQAAGRALELQAAASAFEHSNAGTGTTWHVAGVARLGAGLAVRASQGRSMGAPSITSLFSAATDGFPAVLDPCDTAFGPRSPNAEVNCSNDGVPGDLVDGRGQIRSQTGGNPALRPETADIRSAGIVFAPSGGSGLELSADYFEIAMSDEISTLGAAFILQSCYDRPSGERSNCDRIVRDPATGVIDVINDTLANTGTRETAGVDVQLAHTSQTSAGRLRLHTGGTWLQKYETAGADGIARVGQGVYDLGVHPEYKFDGSLLWDNGLLGAGAHVRYIGGFTECENNDCQAGNTDPEFEPLSREVESYYTADVLGSLTLDSGLGRTVVAVGVRNLLDRQPPVVYNGFLANSDASTYDYMGRFAYLRLTQQF